tara:strand:+ start:29 stop:247 length:219 start_codon:yes stop_codon:yes gene_type:complete
LLKGTGSGMILTVGLNKIRSGGNMVTIKIEVWGDCTVDKVTRKGVKWDTPKNWEWEVVQHIGEKAKKKNNYV